MRSVKRITVLGIVLLATALTVSAIPIPCSTTTTLADLMNMGPDGCQSQDKIFSGFTYSLGLADASLVNVSLVFQVLPGIDIHGWVFSHVGSWSTGFTLAYDIAVAPGNPLVTIYQVKDQINSGAIPNGTSILDTETPNVGPVVVLNPNGAAAGNETRFAGFSPSATSIHTNSVVTIPAGSILISYEQDWFERFVPDVPEPGTAALIGGGVLLLIVGRYRRKRPA